MWACLRPTGKCVDTTLPDLHLSQNDLLLVESLIFQKTRVLQSLYGEAVLRSKDVSREVDSSPLLQRPCIFLRSYLPDGEDMSLCMRLVLTTGPSLGSSHSAFALYRQSGKDSASKFVLCLKHMNGCVQMMPCIGRNRSAVGSGIVFNGPTVSLFYLC